MQSPHIPHCSFLAEKKPPRIHKEPLERKGMNILIHQAYKRVHYNVNKLINIPSVRHPHVSKGF